MSNLVVPDIRRSPAVGLPAAGLLRQHPLAAYYLLALAFSWLVELPLVAVRQGWVSWPIPFAVHYLAAFGPMLAALIVTALATGAAGLGELWGRITRWRVGWKWVLFSTLSPVAVFVICLPVVRLVKGAWPDLRLLGQANFLPNLGVGVLFLWLATYGFGEEIGWRGFALPRLQKRMSVSRATLTLGLMWIVWHLPAFFYLDTYQTLGLWMLPAFAFGVLCAAVVFTWLYNSTGGSVLMVAIWHAVFDLLSASKAGQEIIPMAMTVLIVVGALVITNLDRPWNFHRVAKHVL